jgi:hypothetical protein
MKKAFVIITVCISFITFVLIFVSAHHKAATDKSAVTINTETANKTGQDLPSVTTNTLNINDEFAEDLLPVKLTTDSNIYFELTKSFSNLKLDKLSLVSPIDELGNSLTVSTFLPKVGTLIPDDLIQSSTIKLYIFRGKNDFGPSEALVIENKNDENDNYSLLKMHEAELIEYMKGFVLIGEKYEIIQSSGRQERQFSNSAFYRNSRYVNYTSDKAISLNYLAAGNYIVFANSLSILHNIAHKIFVSESL